MSGTISSQQFKANTQVEVYINNQFLGSYTVRPTGYLSVPVPYDNGEIFTLTGTSKIGLQYTESNQLVNTHSSDKPANIIIHDDVHTVTGTSEANSVIRITDSNGSIVGIATSDYLGKFTVTTAPFAGGEQLNIVATDKDGNVSEPALFTVPQHAVTAVATTESLEVLQLSDENTQVSETPNKPTETKHTIDLDKIIADAAKEHSVAFEKEIPNEATSKHQVDNSADLHTLPIKAHHFEELAQTTHLF